MKIKDLLPQIKMGGRSNNTQLLALLAALMRAYYLINEVQFYRSTHQELLQRSFLIQVRFYPNTVFKDHAGNKRSV